MEKLPKNEQIFVKEVAIHGNATKAVRKAFKEIKSPDYIRRKGSDLITKPHIVKAVEEVKKSIADHFTNEELVKAHRELLVQKQLAYFTFSKQMSNEEIVSHVEAAGFNVIVVRESDKGKLAFYSIDDSNAKKNGLDMIYKLKGAYAPEKSISLNLNGDIIPTEELLELANQLKNNEVTRIDTREHIERNGVDTESVGEEIQD